MSHNRVAAAMGLPLLPEVLTTATCPKCGYRWTLTVARGDSISYSCKACSEAGRGVVTMHLSDVGRQVTQEKVCPVCAAVDDPECASEGHWWAA